MPRRPRAQLGDGLFHVTSRRVEGTPLYRDDRDRRLFVALLRLAATEFAWLCRVYCLMTNHYHLLAQARQNDLSLGMQFLNGCYAQAFNARHRRRGHLFEERFSAFLVEGDNYAERTHDYILENPVRAGLCEHADEWPWSGGPLGCVDAFVTGTVPGSKVRRI
jgi:REP element-mobilizing transposase RayT